MNLSRSADEEAKANIAWALSRSEGAGAGRSRASRSTASGDLLGAVGG